MSETTPKKRVKKTIVKTALTPGGELDRRWAKYKIKVDQAEAPALRTLIKKACDEAGV